MPTPAKRWRLGAGSTTKTDLTARSGTRSRYRSPTSAAPPASRHDEARDSQNRAVQTSGSAQMPGIPRTGRSRLRGQRNQAWSRCKPVRERGTSSLCRASRLDRDRWSRPEMPTRGLFYMRISNGLCAPCSEERSPGRRGRASASRPRPWLTRMRRSRMRWLARDGIGGGRGSLFSGGRGTCSNSADQFVYYLATTGSDFPGGPISYGRPTLLHPDAFW